MPAADTGLFALLILSEFVGCAFFVGQSDWVVLTRRTEAYAYTLQHPESWSIEEDHDTAVFRPPGSEIGDGNITLVVYNPTETPPLPVEITYTTIRIIRVGDREIRVQKRDPASVTERYVAIVSEGDWVAEFRCFLTPDADATFDHMVGSFTFVAP